MQRQMVRWVGGLEEDECEIVEATNGFSAPGNSSRLSRENGYVIFLLKIFILNPFRDQIVSGCHRLPHCRTISSNNQLVPILQAGGIRTMPPARTPWFGGIVRADYDPTCASRCATAGKAAPWP